MSAALKLLEQRATDLGFAKGLLRNVLSAAEAPEGERDALMAFAVAQVRRELSATGRLSA